MLQTPITADEASLEAEVPESQLDKLARLIRRRHRRAEARDSGNLFGIGEIKQMLGTKDRDRVRGLLVKLVARGDVEPVECINGVYWRACGATVSPQRPVETKDGTFVMQRQLVGDPRNLWFDVETFTNRAHAKQAVELARKYALFRHREHGVSNAPIQRIRLIELPADGASA